MLTGTEAIGRDPSPASTDSGRSASTSASSRKNRPQRCSVCGVTGHKSRTCPRRSVSRSEGGRSQLHSKKSDAALLLALATSPVNPSATSSPASKRAPAFELGGKAKAVRGTVGAPRSSSECTPPASPPLPARASSHPLATWAAPPPSALHCLIELSRCACEESDLRCSLS